MANLTKRDIVMQIAEETGLRQKDVFEVVQRTLDCITDSLAKQQNVELRKFGVFEVRLMKQRVGRNPLQPEKNVIIPARATVKFKSGKIMQQKVGKLSASLKQEAASKKKKS